MRQPLNQIILYFFLLLGAFFSSCSNQESWSYKAWHNTLAHYNTFFNAEQKWLETEELTRESFKDDFRKPLVLFNYGGNEALKNNQSAMDEVIKKASTMIDKHPKSRWVDDAYLLNGKAYFLKGEISAAKDLFEYVNEHFTDPKIRFSAQLWIARCLYQKLQWVDAEVLAQSILINQDLPNSLLGETHKVLGSIQFALGKYTQSAAQLELALPNSNNRMDQYRLHFALGQCYQFDKQFDLAGSHFSKVPTLNPPYELAFHARMAQVGILSAKQENYTKANKVLSKMLKDDKNIDFYGQIYVSMGNNELKANNISLAIKRYNQAIQLSSAKEHKTNAYLALGNYFFSNLRYEKAALYYDSANNIIDESHPDFEEIVRRNDILSDLLTAVMTISQNDSLLRMANDPIWRTKKIKEAIEREKTLQEAALSKKKNINYNNQANNNANPASMPGMNGMSDMGMPNPLTSPDLGMRSTSGNSSFPFYNALNRSKGEQEFKKIWSTRSNIDYWRYGAKKSVSEPINGTMANTTRDSATEKKTQKSDTIFIPSDVLEAEKKYYVELPLSEEAKKIALAEIEKSLFEAARIYQDRLQDSNESIRLYSELINRFPQSENSAQAHYELIKLYRVGGDFSQADAWKSKLIANFPKSIYVRLLESGGILSEIVRSNSGDKIIDSLFQTMVNAYNKGLFKEAIVLKMQADKNYSGNQLQIKFDYLQAIVFIKQGNTEKGIELLKQLVADYQSSDITLRAKDIVEANDRMMAAALKSEDTSTAVSVHYQQIDGEALGCIFIFAKGSNTNLIRAALSDFNKKQFVFETLDISMPLSIGSRYILRISNFTKSQIAKDFIAFASKSKAFFSEKGLYEYQVLSISEPNFILLTQTLDLSAYQLFYEKNK